MIFYRCRTQVDGIFYAPQTCIKGYLNLRNKIISAHVQNTFYYILLITNMFLSLFLSSSSQ
jgi:hypothetical protein